MGVKNQKILQSSSRKLTVPAIERKKNKRPKKPALYMGEKKSKIRDRITSKTHKSIPVLKNGNLSLSPVTIEKEDYYFGLTCGFDSVLQIILAHAYDDEQFFEKVIRV